MDLRATLRDVTVALGNTDCRWAVIGGVAAALHGRVRTTVDLDLLVEVEDTTTLDVALASLGYRLEHRWEESSHYSCERVDCCPIDVLHAKRPHTRAMLARAREVALDEELSAPVIEIEDLIGLKLQAAINDPDRRRAELVDIRELLEVAAERRSLELSRVHEYFALFREEGTLDELLEGLRDALA
jgi:hypothetical protein